MINSKPLLTIICITYNHEHFIREAINGFLSQVVDFPFEIIIHDDASTDGTPSIVREYQKKYPQTIKAILREQNQYSIGGFVFLVDVFKEAQGTYIALCEGDDYWTDPLKLQKQLDFLEDHPDFSICFHAVKILENDHLRDDDITQVPSQESTILDLATLGNYIHTPSCVFRNHGAKIFGTHFSESSVGDYYLHMMNAQYGKIYYLKEIMAVYRVHSTSYWSSKDQFYREKKFQLTRIAILKDLLPTSSEAIKSLAEAYFQRSLHLISKFGCEDFIPQITNNPSFFPRPLLIKSLVESQNQISQMTKEIQQLKSKSVVQHIKERTMFKLKSIWP